MALATTNEAEIKYWLISYTDLFGYQRAKLAPAAAFNGMKLDGAGFAGFASWLDLTPAHGDLMAIPDMDSAVRLPWRPDVAWVASDLVLDGEPLAHAPRNALKALIADARAKGVEMRTGVEAEFFLLAPDGSKVSDAADRAEKPCYDQAAVMRRYDVISEICDHMQTLGWGPYQNDHEDANGQFEMNWEYASALQTADRHAFFKFLVKTVAETHGYRATFMPKPFPELTGNGCHAHVSLWSPGGEDNLFLRDADVDGLSPLGKNFLAGVLHHAPSLAAIANPTVNSYKRIQPGMTRSGATWAPNAVSWSGNNRTHMVRIPEPGRFELRLADGAANPYLLQAGILAAGLNGMETKPPLPPRADENAYEKPLARSDGRMLPGDLSAALDRFESDAYLRERLGASVSTAYLKLKRDEWRRFLAHHSAWEVENAMDL